MAKCFEYGEGERSGAEGTVATRDFHLNLICVIIFLDNKAKPSSFEKLPAKVRKICIVLFC